MSLLNWPAPRQPRHDMVSSEERLAAYSHYQSLWREDCQVPGRPCNRGFRGAPARARVFVIATGDYCAGEAFGACTHHMEQIERKHGFVQCEHGFVRMRAFVDL